MPHFIIYDQATGQILRSGFASSEDDVALQARGDRWAIKDRAYESDRYYVEDVNIAWVAERPEQPISIKGTNIVPADGATPVVFTGVAEGTPIVVTGAGNGVFVLMADGTGVLEVTFDWPATYKVSFGGWPQREKSFDAQARPVTP